MHDRVRVHLVESLRSGRGPQEAAVCALEALPDLVAELTPLLRSAAQGATDAVWQSLLTEAGVARGPGALAQKKLASFTTDRWPLVVSHPLSLLDSYLARATTDTDPAWAAALLAMRDTTEGCARAMWAGLLHEVLALQSRVPSWAALAPDVQQAIRSVAATLGGGFTLGTVGWLAGTGRALAPLAALTLGSDPSPALPLSADLWSRRSAWQGPLARFQVWRNTDLGHGLVGDEARLCALFRAKDGPFDQLVSVLEGIGPWLVLVQQQLDWPYAPDASPGRTGGPVAWRGQGEALWLIEGAARAGFLLRGITRGERTTEEDTAHILDWLGLAATTVSRASSRRTWLLGASTDEQQALAEQAARRGAQLEAGLGALQRVVFAKLATHRCVAVRGSAGTGKSWLLSQMAASAVGDARVVLFTRAQPGVPLTASRVAADLDGALRRSRSLLLPDGGGGSLSTLPQEAERFWRVTSDLNPDVEVIVVVDGLDEGDARTVVGLFAVLPPADLPNVSVLLSYRSLPELHEDLREPLRDVDVRAIDLDQFYGEPHGQQILTKYLEAKHSTLSRELHAPILSAARNRFLWVFHYARGLELGLFEGHRHETWPAPEALYPRYLAALEARTGNHPGYSRTLREVLLTLAEAEVPLNDETLVELLATERLDAADAPTADEEFHWAWLRPVLHDVADFVERIRVDVRDPAPDVVDAADIVRDDVLAGDDRAAFVRRIAHATLRDFLREGEIGLEWSAARAVVRARLAERTSSAAQAWAASAASGDDETDVAPARAPTRYALRAWAAHGVRGGDEPRALAARAEILLEQVPNAEHAARAGCLAPWRRTALAWAGALDDLGGDDRATAARLWSWVGHAALLARDVGEAVVAHQRELRLRLALVWLAEDPSDDALEKALAAHGHVAIRDLAIAWASVGRAAQAGRDVQHALRAHGHELRASLVLAGLAADPSDDALEEALAAHGHDAVRDLAIAWANVGHAALGARDTHRALLAHQRELRLKLALAGLPESPGADALEAAVAHKRDTVRDLAIAWDNLGSAAREGHDTQRALLAHRRALQFLHALAGLAEDPSDDALEKAFAAQRHDAIRDLAVAWANAGNAALQAREPERALLAHRRSLRLMIGLSGLAEEPSDDALREVLGAQKHDSIRGLAIAWSNVGWAAEHARDTEQALLAHQRELRLKLALAGLAEDPSDEALGEALAAHKHDALRNLAIAWGSVGRAANGARDTQRALLAHRRELRFMLALAGLAEDPNDDAVEEALAAHRHDALRDLALAWGNVGRAAQAARDTERALLAHRRELRFMLALSGLAEDPSDDALEEALAAHRHDALRDLAIAWGNVGLAAQVAGDTEQALTAFRRALRLVLVLAGLAQDPSEEALREALVAHKHDALRSLAVGWASVGLAAQGANDDSGALLAYERAVRLLRHLAEPAMLFVLLERLATTLDGLGRNTEAERTRSEAQRIASG